MKIAILGCGPAGLLAKHAAEENGFGLSSDVFAHNPQKSPMPGAQFLHTNIPGITEDEPDGIIANHLIGEHPGYRTKVYGDLKLPKEFNQVSAEGLVPEQNAWNLRTAYDRLWEMYGDLVMDTDLIDPEWVDGTAEDYDLILSTIPLSAICMKGHQFAGVKVNIGADYFFGSSFAHEGDENLVVCNGEQNPSWYRTSRVFGASHTEWPAEPVPPLENIVQVTKPLFSQCDCYDGTKVKPLGRYGAWRKGILVHEVFKEVYENLSILA